MEKVTYTKEQSSNIASAEYNPEKQMLFMQFHNGYRYVYTEVPIPIWEGLKNASSKGTYFHDNIRDRYKYTRIW